MRSLLCIVVLHFFLKLLAAQDLCDRYGGGWLVWPEDKTRTVEHAVHWSKAQSKGRMQQQCSSNLFIIYNVLHHLKCVCVVEF